MMIDHRQRLCLEIDEAQSLAAHTRSLATLWENVMLRRQLELKEYDKVRAELATVEAKPDAGKGE
jgi:hypothetical protein